MLKVSTGPPRLWGTGSAREAGQARGHPTWISAMTGPTSTLPAPSSRCSRRMYDGHTEDAFAARGCRWMNVSMRHLTDDEAARAAERTLYRSEARLRGILETADAAFASIDAEGLILDWNATAEEMFGWPREDALGRAVVET